MTRANISQASAQSFPALAEFKVNLPRFNLHPEHEAENTITRPAFVRTAHLRKWLASTTEEGPAKVTNIERLIEDAHQRRGGKYATLPPNNASPILEHYCLVLSLLLEAEKGHLIGELRRQQITDEKLCDLHEKQLEEKLWVALEADHFDNPEEHVHHHKALFKIFSQRRWAYRPHIFKYDDNPELPAPTILPIYKRERVNRGGTAALHQLCIPEEYLDDSMKKHLNGSSFPVKSVGMCYNLAVKTFTESGRADDPAKELFQKECEAYQHLKGHGGMVQYLGAYSQRNHLGQVEHNILLEYGDYDLAEYFLFSPPVHPVNVCNLWHDLFDVVDALARLHKFGRVRCGQREEVRGWHNDIKPDNILSVKGQLKLADPGFAGFAQHVQGQDTPRASVTLMSSTYGPPESHLASHETEMPQAADMWSLGCVLSEAATWLILGPPGLTQYRTLRKEAIRHANEVRRRRASNITPNSRRSFEGDFFHDGQSVLPEIRQWHSYLVSNMRKGDQLSEMILGIIDRDLLQSDPRTRCAHAGALCVELNEIRARYPREQNSGLFPAVDKAVTDVEARLKWQPIEALLGQSISIQIRKALKSKGYLDLPRDGIAHLSEMIKDRVEAPARRPSLSLDTNRDSRNSDGMLYMASPAALTPVQPADSYEMPQASPQHTAESPFTMAELAKRQSPYPHESIFDVHYAKIEPKRLSLKGIKGRFGGAKDKDSILAEHYQKRDIKFIVDNSDGMIPEWQKVRFVLEKISKKAAWIDEDGMDLDFTNRCSRKLKIRENTLVQDIENAMSSFKPHENEETDMATKLRAVLEQWLDNPRKSMTLIVLTDGRWRRTADSNEVEDTIVVFDEEIRKLPGAKLKRRRVSIQFISFGDDPGALYRLRHLDNDLVFDRNIEDIVDTEPWTGDVYKMLLGSHVADMDNTDDVPERSDAASSIVRRRESTPIQAHQQYNHQTPTRRERNSNPQQFQMPMQPVPRDDNSSQSTYHTARESTDRRQRQNEPGGYYGYVT